jgi:hypothetical protein
MKESELQVLQIEESESELLCTDSTALFLGYEDVLTGNLLPTFRENTTPSPSRRILLVHFDP